MTKSHSFDALILLTSTPSETSILPWYNIFIICINIHLKKPVDNSYNFHEKLSSGKMIVLFPENMILPLGRKMKDDLSQKNIWKYDIFFRCSKTMVFSKKLYWNMIFLLLSEKMVVLKEYMETWYFLCICVGVTDVVLCPFAKNNQRQSSPVKMHLKVIETLDWYPRKSSNNFLYFYGGLYRRFRKLLSSRKKNRNLIYRIETWLILQLIRSEIFYNEESSILCTIQLPGVVFGGVPERESRKLFAC